ncbi:MAG: modification methylase [Chloroflexi bacterium]|nr:MAG: modification methylase [Chloroflexota bacterium]
MAGKNAPLGRASIAKQDEFYTRLEDIETELHHYRHHFAGKVVFCNCDDPYESNFFKYFAMNFDHLGLKKLITTSYTGSPISGEQLILFDPAEQPRPAHRVEITEVSDLNGDGAVDLLDVEHLLKSNGSVVTRLEADGDFRSPESVALLDEADIVVTNPPFSLFREYVGQLIEHNKHLLIIGSKNAITYASIFRLIMDNRLWLGHGFNNGNAYFRVPDSYKGNFVDGVFDETTGLVKFRNVGWFTNLDTTKRHEDLILYKTYDPDEYPTYDNYDAIEVARVADIPCDYDGVMGVPLTFLDMHNPDQFEIVGLSGSDDYPMTKKYGKKERVVDGKRMKSNTGTLRAVIRTESFGAGTHFDVSYPVKGVYRRLFIRRKR